MPKNKRQFSLWHWLLDKGLVFSFFFINVISMLLWVIAMVFVSWFTKD